MNIIDHGTWVSYTPDTPPTHAPANAIFARRESDGQDWYELVISDAGLRPDTVKFTAIWSEGYNSYYVCSATFDGTKLFPAGQIVQEITDYTGSDPQADFGSKLYDPATGSFTDPPPPTASNFEARLAALEVKVGGA